MKVLMPTFSKLVLRLGLCSFLFCAGIVGGGLGGTAAQAQSDTPLDQLFTIRAIRVDEIARSSNRARQEALLTAEQEAYDKLLKKITQQVDRQRLPALSAQERQALISGLEIVEEQSSSRRYLATLNVRFEPSRVSSFLASYGVPHVLGTGRPILVLHAHKRGLTTFLWQPDQAMIEARATVDWVNRIRGYEFARGEIRERLALTASEVLDFNVEPALAVGSFNSLQSTVMISSEVKFDRAGNMSLLFRYLATDSGVSGQGEIALSSGKEATALAQMYDQILEVIDGAWRERLLVDTGSQGELEVLVPSLELASYAEIEKRLSEVTLVQSFSVMAVGLPLSQLHLIYTGREDQLALALRFEGLDLRPYGDQIILELRD